MWSACTTRNAFSVTKNRLSRVFEKDRSQVCVHVVTRTDEHIHDAFVARVLSLFFSHKLPVSSLLKLTAGGVPINLRLLSLAPHVESA
jgi:hypothetical protein